MIPEKKKQYAAALLREKAAQTGQTPKKSDFDPLVLSQIKAYLGPWPRALEYAGLKAPKQESAKPKKRNAKRRKP